MTSLIIFAFLAVLGLLGAIFLVGKKVFEMRPLSLEEQKSKLQESPPFFDFVKTGLIIPAESFLSGVFHPFLLKLAEKGLRRFRILILKVESLLHKVSDRFRAKHIAIKNGNDNGSGNGSKNGKFWNELKKTKDEFQRDNPQEKK